MLILASALLTSAFLLFWVQPLFAKMILPVLGGTPAVWNTTMVFFQVTLVIGYALAHGVRRWVPLRQQPWIHLGVSALALLTLPPYFAPPANPEHVLDNPVWWLLVTLAQHIALPAVALAMNTPLLQHYLANSTHPQRDNPYPLYAASNAGSLTALLLFPLMLEPLLPVNMQKLVWTGGYGVFVLLLAVYCWRWQPQPRIEAADSTRPAPDRSRYALWLALAAVPSGLMLAVTNHITTDVAAAPLFWVLPLALYLLSFILAFARTRPEHQEGFRALSYAKTLALLVVVINSFWGAHLTTSFSILFHLCTFFLLALLLHGRLARLAPEPQHLTRFYLALSVGGAIGGSVVSLAFPLLTTAVYEYPVFLIMAVFLLPAYPGLDTRWRFVFVLAAVANVVTFILAEHRTKLSTEEIVLLCLVLGGLAGLFANAQGRPRFQSLVLLAIVGLGFYSSSPEALLWQDRSFFGIIRVYDAADEGVRHFQHGTTLHGQQYLDPTRRSTPLTYYHPEGDYGRILAEIVEKKSDAAIGFAGLGAAASTCYGTSAARFTFFEIDPMVAYIARDSGLFTYWRDCPSTKELVMGDARLTLAQQPDGRFDALFLDAFTSDAIPMHLLTLEAMQLYARKMRPDGVLIYHISNRHLDLTPQLVAQARHLGFQAQVNTLKKSDDPLLQPVTLVSVLMPQRSLPPGGDRGVEWWRLDENPDFQPPSLWRDDFANILSAFK